jgi:alpha-glucosidase
MKNSITNAGIVCLLVLIMLLGTAAVAEKNISVFSPDKRTEIKISLSDHIRYSVVRDGKTVIAPSPISIILDDGTVIGANPRLTGEKHSTVARTIKTLYGTNTAIQDNYNQVILTFKDHYALHVRAFNEGVAFRFVTSIKGAMVVKNEESVFTFPENCKAFYITGEKNNYLYEGSYNHWSISRIDSGRVAVLPMVVQIANGPRLAITEADLVDYPGMYLESNGAKSLKSYFSPYPLKTDNDPDLAGGHWAVHVTEGANYIARTSGSRSFPWRIIMIADEDKDLMKNELVYLLAAEQKKEIDFSWVRPGTIINDWWDILPGSPQEVILTGVDFKSGINYDTYKYYIDFAIAHNIEYVNIDYGWSDPHDFSKIHPNFDIQKLLSYSREKHKKVMLWCISKTLYRNLEENMAMFEKWGVGGLKVDFFERDDQVAINDYIRIADAAARHHLLLEYHGASKPTGLSRTYPNVLTYEGVKGSEWNKGSKLATPDHDVTMPFMRTLAGAFDYGPGVLRNANKANFCALGGLTMSQGTRCHQLAMFMIYYSPLQFMADVPTNYIREPVMLDFLASIPTVWDVTYPLDSQIGQYITIARKKGDTWFVGSMTSWEARPLKIKCDFLDGKIYNAEIYQDGLNAHLNGIDYKKIQTQVKKGDILDINMAPGGGWAAKLTPIP